MIRLLPDAAELIARHAEQTYPDECVGLLLGRLTEEGSEVLVAVPLENRWSGQVQLSEHDNAESRHDRFYLDPRDYLRAEREARIRKLDVVGCYHSHPDCPPEPSERDRVGAQGIGSGSAFTFLIQRVDQSKANELRAWFLMDDGQRFEQTMLEPLDDLPFHADSAGGIVVREVDGQMKLALASIFEHTIQAPLWTVPKGRVNRDELIEQAALREISEEIGLSRICLVTRLGQIQRVALTDENRTMRKRITWYLAYALSNETPQLSDPDVREVRWFTITEALMALPFAEERWFLREYLLPWLEQERQRDMTA